MLHANPRFVLRQWLLEEIIKRVQDDTATGKRALAKVHEVCSQFYSLLSLYQFRVRLLQMATNPYDRWGAEGDERPVGELTEEEREERRFCGLGAQKFLGFQCSCSS